MDKNREPTLETEEGPNSRWLKEAIRVSRSVIHEPIISIEPEFPSAEFMVRSSKAAAIACSIAKLRAERERLGFIPLPIMDYLRSIAKSANVLLDPVLSWAGIKTDSSSPVELARGWTHLARQIGLELQETILQFRLSFAEAVGHRPVLVAFRPRRSVRGEQDQIHELETSLAAIESNFDAPLLSTLRDAERQITDSFHRSSEER